MYASLPLRTQYISIIFSVKSVSFKCKLNRLYTVRNLLYINNSRYQQNNIKIILKANIYIHIYIKHV